MARLLIKMYKIPKESEDYITLHDWNKLYQRSRRFSIDEKKIRDLPLQASRIISKRRPIVDKLEEYTVPQINSSLDQLALEKVSQGQIDILKPLFDNLSIPEVRWLIHILLNKSILTSMERFFQHLAPGWI